MRDTRRLYHPNLLQFNVLATQMIEQSNALAE